jgi:RNA polymerase sigma-70 factor, ECF subfamily
MRAAKASEDGDELAKWLADGYSTAFRTAFLILHDRRDAEEAVQDAFLRAWRFRAAVPQGDGIRPWMYRVVVNSCISKLRADRRHRDGSVPFDFDEEDGEPGGGRPTSESGPESVAVVHETQDAVTESLASLPEHLRIVIVLRFYGGLSEREIASAIHRRPGTVKSRLHEARSRLSSDPRLSCYKRSPVPVAAGTLDGGADDR